MLTAGVYFSASVLHSWGVLTFQPMKMVKENVLLWKEAF